MMLAKMNDQGGTSLQYNTLHEESSQVKPADWALMLEVATQRRTEVLMPENLENTWTKGRNYKRKENKIIKGGYQDLPAKSTSTDSSLPQRKLAQETKASKRGKYDTGEGMPSLPQLHALSSDPLQNVGSAKNSESSQNPDKNLSFAGDLASDGYKSPLKSEGFWGKSSADMIVRKEGPLVSKLHCWIAGLWPGGKFFLRVEIPQIISNNSDQKLSQILSRSGGSNTTKSESGSFKQQLEAARRATPTPLVTLIGHKQYIHCDRDIYYFSQSNTCVKQLAYAILELVLVYIFPEMRDVVFTNPYGVLVHDLWYDNHMWKVKMERAPFGTPTCFMALLVAGLHARLLMIWELGQWFCSYIQLYKAWVLGMYRNNLIVGMSHGGVDAGSFLRSIIGWIMVPRHKLPVMKGDLVAK
ncbi:hypothetical protein VNO78_06484 [Psophocarpus tetragonolobus]|uniref:Uncharacterized protein n=1 Tax=Psophocarpus tetragonolobus TaxID=3891 RepID=A0AAN9SV88_PSOTE